MAPKTKEEKPLEEGKQEAPKAEKSAGAPDKVSPSGQFQVLQFGKEVRLYNPEGQAVSPAHGANEVSEDTLGANGKPLTLANLLNKKAARFNAQLRQSKAAPTKKKNVLAEEAAKQVAEAEASEEA